MADSAAGSKDFAEETLEEFIIVKAEPEEVDEVSSEHDNEPYDPVNEDPSYKPYTPRKRKFVTRVFINRVIWLVIML